MNQERSVAGDEHSAVIRDDLEALFGLDRETGRPCGDHCHHVCTVCGSTECRCGCASTCTDIPYVLSSDPVDDPLEMGIAPLVYELNRLKVFHPCWSCEGHDRVGDSFWKAPKVWFYCRSVVHLRLLSDSLAELHARDIIGVPWQVRLTFSRADDPDTMFSVEPIIDRANVPTLNALHADVSAIADCLHGLITGRARILYRHA